MKLAQSKIQEKKLNQLKKASIYLQGTGLTLIALLTYYSFDGFKAIGLLISALVFVLSVFVSRKYSSLKNELKRHRTDSLKSSVSQYIVSVAKETVALSLMCF